ncbi:hypothetical protein QFZ60_002983 [Arthrobacter sp. B2I5]|nr:hypothetical protein [Arthrobacter sp. B2I5]
MDFSDSGPCVALHMPLRNPYKEPACPGKILIAGNIANNLSRLRVSLAVVFHGGLQFRVAQVRLTYDAGAQVRAHVQQGFGQARVLQCKPQFGFLRGIRAHPRPLQGNPCLPDAGCPLVPVQHVLQVLHRGVRPGPALELRSRDPQEVVGHNGQLFDAHLAGTVQPRPCPRGDQESVVSHDLIRKELAAVPPDSAAARNRRGVRPGDVGDWVVFPRQEPREGPQGEGCRMRGSTELGDQCQRPDHRLQLRKRRVQRLPYPPARCGQRMVPQPSDCNPGVGRFLEGEGAGRQHVRHRPRSSHGSWWQISWRSC